MGDFEKFFPLYLPFFPSVIESPEEMLFLDLETTSLSMGAGNFPFLTGIGWFEGSLFIVSQYLITSPPQEVEVLKILLDHWNRSRVIVTYNGKTFDVPLLKGRFSIYRLGEPDEKKHYDLYQLVRGMVKPATLHNAERVLLGIERNEEFEGSDIPSIYFSYINTGDLEVLKPVLERNLQDILSLPALLFKWVEKKNPLFFNKH